MPPAAPRSRAPTGLVLTLPAHDLAATRDFYLRDLRLRALDDAASRLRIGMGAATLEFVQHDGWAPASEDHRLTFRCPEPAALLKRLRALGVEVDVPPAPTDGVLFFARDPDGRLVAFTAAATPQ